MSAPAPTAPGLLEKVSRGAPRVLLGLFVLGQAAYLVASNLVEMRKTTRQYLRDARAKDGWAWRLIAHSGDEGDEQSKKTALEQAVAEWVGPEGDEQSKKTALGRIYAWVEKRTTWWERKAKQPQGWGLFAPDVVDWTCFPSLELRWDGPWGSRRDPVTLFSENEPPDKRRFVRLGRFRLRRYEALLDVRPIDVGEQGAEPTPEQKDALGDRMLDLVRSRDDKILAYMRWRLRRYQDEHPDVPEPTAVILHTRGWIIPKPPEPEEVTWRTRFTGWRFAGDYPVARWKPDGNSSSLEVYVPRHGYFKKPER